MRVETKKLAFDPSKSHDIYSQTWTCADGSFIKVTIPDGATREDVLCMMDMLAVIAERRYPEDE